MILQLTEVQAELLYRMLGGKTQDTSADVGDTIDLGSGLIGGEVSAPKLTDLATKEVLLTNITALRQREDQRSIVRLGKVIADLESSGFNEETITDLRKAQTDATTHKSKKYALPKTKKSGDL